MTSQLTDRIFYNRFDDSPRLDATSKRTESGHDSSAKLIVLEVFFLQKGEEFMQDIIGLFFWSVALLYSWVPRPFGYPVAFLIGLVATALILLAMVLWSEGWLVGKHEAVSFVTTYSGVMILGAGGLGTAIVTWLIVVFNPELREKSRARANERGRDLSSAND